MDIAYREWDRDYARRLLGDDVVGALRRVVDADECFYVSSSASLVFGLVTSDGDRVALKIVPLERRTLDEVSAVVDVQRGLHSEGFPAPRPLRDPCVLGEGVATVDEWVDGEQVDLHEPALRAVTARLLADLVARARNVPSLPAGIGRGHSVFPPPHNPMFDFARPEGAWVDDIARTVRPLLPAERDVVGHNDWSTKNMAWRDGSVVAVFDWSDSLVLEAEEVVVGQASVTFPATWDLPVEPKLATPAEAEAFVREYEDARDIALDPEALRAAQLYIIAYSARCEISDGVEGEFCARLREAV